MPIEPDGSAYFKAPVGVPVYFQVLDGDGMAIQSMRSVTYVHPGEDLTCQGCHERKNRPQSRAPRPLALRRGPSEVVADVDGSWPLSFPRLVQPVLDRKCVACHQKKKACPLDAAASGKRGWSGAYQSLLPFVNWCGGKQRTHLQPYARGGGSRSIPGQFGAKASKLFKDILNRDHHQLKLSPQQRHRIAVWIDGNANFHGAYENTEAQRMGKRVTPALE